MMTYYSGEDNKDKYYRELTIITPFLRVTYIKILIF